MAHGHRGGRRSATPCSPVAMRDAPRFGSAALRGAGVGVRRGARSRCGSRAPGSRWAGPSEGAFLVWLGLRERRQWLRLGGGVLLGARDLARPRVASTRPRRRRSRRSPTPRALSCWRSPRCCSGWPHRYRRARPRRRAKVLRPAIAACLLTAAVMVLLVITERDQPDVRRLRVAARRGRRADGRAAPRTWRAR